MHSQPTPKGRGETAVERAVLAVALATHPKPLSVALLAAEIGDAKAAEEAVGQLRRVGLLDRDGDSLSATPAAVHFDQLGL